jgi:hypothetical protein
LTDLLPGRRGEEIEPRTIWVNDAPRNKSEGKKWKGNYVSTSKYNIITFLPIFIVGERSLLVVWKKLEWSGGSC